jgi:hypothetical protein
LKRAWKTSWLCVSVLATLLPVGAVRHHAVPAKRANELTIGRLRPGRDTLAGARTMYGARRFEVSPTDRNVWTWEDACRNAALRVEANDHDVVQTLTLSGLSGGECKDLAADALRGGPWKTGRGLGFGDTRRKVVELYGPPNSSSPSVLGQRELELLFYAFDWAGSDVPQVMEVMCDRGSGRVVEITLAFPSL